MVAGVTGSNSDDISSRTEGSRKIPPETRDCLSEYPTNDPANGTETEVLQSTAGCSLGAVLSERFEFNN